MATMLDLTEIAGKAAGKAVGAARAASGALYGYRAIFRTLKREHGELQVMLLRLAMESHAARIPLYREVRAEMLAHARAEEEHFYAFVASSPDARPLVAHHEDAHQRMDELLELLDTLADDDRRWKQYVSELQEVFRAHVEEEETLLFPAARRLLSDAQAEAIDRRYRVTREQYLLLQSGEGRRRHVS